MVNKKQTFFAAIIGNILEYYDFTVYLVFSVTIGKVFFFTNSELVQVLSSLAVFATGFITRPLGGFFFGHIGDKYGRKISLICSILSMTISTFSIGLLPSYNQIGIYAPLLLIIFRLLQGLCISGEGANTAIFILEHYHNSYPGFICSLVHGSNIVGTLLAAFIGIMLNTYVSVIFAWRIAFIIGGIFGILGLYLRLKISETPVFLALQEKKKIHKFPLLCVIKNAPYSMILTFCTGAVASSLVYLVKTYINVFYTTVLHLDNIITLWYLMYASIILILSMPLFGIIVDIIGKKVMIILSSILITIMIVPTMFLMGCIEKWQHLLSITLLSILAGAISSTAYPFIISLFSAEERSSGVSFSYNLGIALFGGTSPIISRALVEITGLFYAPGFYIMLITISFIISLKIFLPKVQHLISK